MTNKYFIATVMLLAAGYVSAQNKLSPSAINILEQYKEAPASRGAAPEVFAIVSLNSPDDLEEFETLGLEITDDADGILLVHIPMDRIEEVAAMDCVRSISFGQQAYPLMDKALETSNVKDVHDGKGLSKAYTGAGVVTGLFDTGIDAEHINFTDENGESRVIAASKIISGNASNGSFSTDLKTETHGTHVLGIMAGSYKGPGDFSGQKGAEVPYYGVATGSDIVITAGDLYDSNMLAGVKYIIDKAKAEGKPAVINLSIGTTIGSHDGTSDFNRKLDAYGKEAIITISAGNDGTIKMGTGKTFTATDNKLMTSIYPVDASTEKSVKNVKGWTGTVGFYAGDSRPFKLSIAVIDLMTPSDPKIMSEYVISESTKGTLTYVGGSTNTATSYEPLEGFDYAFTEKTTNYCKVYTNVNPSNNCYYANIDFSFNIDSEKQEAAVVAFIIEGQEGQTVRGFVNSTGSSRDSYTAQFSDRGVSTLQGGEPNGTINDMACGKNVVVVGSYNSRNRWPSVTSAFGASVTSYTVGDISEFSSYGSLPDGRNLPHICAPGAFIVSSYNHYYTEDNRASASDLCAKVTDDYTGEEFYWGRMQGTSMSSPYAAGVFALWLEANPNLDVEAIRDIAAKTAIVDRYVQQGEPVQWGAGKIDAYEGLKMALNYTSSVTDVLADKAIIYSEVAPGVYDIFAQGARRLDAALYSLNGGLAAATTATGESATLSAEGLASGVYILRLTADGTTETHKVIVK